MTPQAQEAFNELEAMGVPVIECDDESHFRISGEDNDGDTIWADYYKEYQMDYMDDFGVHKDIVSCLARHGLYAEWANSGYLNVYNNA